MAYEKPTSPLNSLIVLPIPVSPVQLSALPEFIRVLFLALSSKKKKKKKKKTPGRAPLYNLYQAKAYFVNHDS
jgi:hypothetical protein